MNKARDSSRVVGEDVICSREVFENFIVLIPFTLTVRPIVRFSNQQRSNFKKRICLNGTF